MPRPFVPYQANGYVNRQWQGQQRNQGQTGRFASQDQANVPRPIEGFNRRPLQITGGDYRNVTNAPAAASPPSRGNGTSNQQNRPWQNRSYGRPPFPSTNVPAVRAYHGDAAPKEAAPESEPYNDHQDYMTYEEQFYENTENVYWTGHNETQHKESNEGSQLTSNETPTNQNETMDTFFDISRPTVECRRCKQPFDSKNRLHNHLRAGCKSSRENRTPKHEAVAILASTPEDSRSEIVESDATDDRISGYRFREWQYVTAMVRLHAKGTSEPICLDTGCTMSIIDREFLLQQVPEVIIQRMASPIMVRDVGQGTYSCNEFARLDIYLQENPIALIHRDVHIVDKMKAKMLIGIDIIGSERIVLDIPQQIAIVGSCKCAKIPITVVPRAAQRVTRPIKALKNVTIPPHSHLSIPIQQQDLPEDRDLLFEPIDHTDGIAVYAHIVDCNMAAIQARNDSESPITLRKDTLLGIVGEYEADGCFRAHPDMALLAATSNIPNERQSIREVLAVAMTTNTEKGPDNSTTAPETRTKNGVTIYGDNPSDFEAVVNSFPDLWKDNGSAVDIPEEQWMDIPLLENWRDLYNPCQAKVYPLGVKDREEVDKLFDKLHEQDRMEWTASSTSFTYLCFVVWRTVNGQ